ncbi:MAG TPA: DUF2142 domain-containing protein [Acidimicrobiales bacterium]|nr:DUF2142 domain-containing protein [Acidimicrobiales bacterium]
MTATEDAPRRRWAVAPPALLALFYALLSLAWILGNPAGAAPDEPSHYLRAVALAGGEVTGKRVSTPQPAPGTSQREAWLRRTTRYVDVPAGLSPLGLDCNAFMPHVSAECQEGRRVTPGPTKGFTNFALTHPTTYLVPGVLARFADDPMTAIKLGRLGNAVVSVGLVWVAIALLWDRSVGLRSIVGLLAAATPMVIFVASSLTASGPEVAAGICFFSALLRVTRPSKPRTWNWVFLGLSGVLLAAGRTLGPLTVAFQVGMVIVAHGFRRSWALLRSAGSPAFWASAAVAVAVGLSVGWELAVAPHGRLGVSALRAALGPSLRDLRRVLGELVGVFGWLDSPAPSFVYVLWWAALAALVSVALLVAGRRERLVLALLAAGAAVLTLGIAVLNLAQTGFGMQGRYVLPMAVGVPLFAGEVLVRNPGRWSVPVDRWLGPFFVLAGGLHAMAWYANARRSALGTDGSWLFMGSSEWSPSTGWYPLALLVVLAVMAVALCAIDLGRQGDEAAAT